jgi:hypothetical protein
MENHNQHLEFHNKILDDPGLAPMFGYWEFETFWQKMAYWLKTGVWPKRKWVNGMLATLEHIFQHEKVQRAE